MGLLDGILTSLCLKKKATDSKKDKSDEDKVRDRLKSLGYLD